MAVIGAKGNFAGPGASFDGEDEKKHEIVCTQVNYKFYQFWIYGKLKTVVANMGILLLISTFQRKTSFFVLEEYWINKPYLIFSPH